MPAVTRASRAGGLDAAMLMPAGRVSHVVLEAGVAQLVAVPDGATLAVFHSHGARFYALWSSTSAAAVPDETDLDTATEDTPLARDVTAENSVSIVAPTRCTVSVAWYIGR